MEINFEWCKKKGMKLIDPNTNVAEDYFKSAEDTLRSLKLAKDKDSNMWLAAKKYYAEYLAAYSVLMRIGVKSEIHSCTIDIIKLLEKKGIIDFNFSKILEDDKELRIDNQYYLKNKSVRIDEDKLDEVLLKIREILDRLTDEQINEIRTIIKQGFYKEDKIESNNKEAK